jgi:ATP phosphoribosyltransferase
VKVRNLGYGAGVLYLAAGEPKPVVLEEMSAWQDVIRIASEYPNLAEHFALNQRLKRFTIFPLWGGAEVYPPENADLVLVRGSGTEEFVNGLTLVKRVLNYQAFLIANKHSLAVKDMSHLLTSLEAEITPSPEPPEVEVNTTQSVSRYPRETTEDTLRLALPDGHQQKHILQLLDRAGIKIDDYPSVSGNRRPVIHLDNVIIKVIRPQDMPLQVANNNFDLAITGEDWVREHLYQFPSSPITRLLDLKSGMVRIVAVISDSFPVDDVNGLRQLNTDRPEPFKVASEYASIADKYARDNHLGMYQVVPTWGASEAFLPDDADLLIENTETGGTIARHNLKIIDTLFISTACLVGNKQSISHPIRGERIKSICEMLRVAVEDDSNESY